MQPGTQVFLNGRFLPRQAAQVPVDDPGLLYGAGVFETLRLYRGRPFLLEAHLERLHGGLLWCGVRRPPELDALATAIDELVQRNGLMTQDARVRITVTVDESNPVTCLITADPLAPLRQTTVLVELAAERRHPAAWNRFKTTSLLVRRIEGRSPAAFDVLQWNTAGCLTEGARTNVFLVDAGGVLRTSRPAEGCLPGITRGAVLRIASASGLRYIEGGVTTDIVAAAREMFVTNSVHEIVPVRRLARLDEPQALSVDFEAPGPVTAELQRLFRLEVGEATCPRS